MADNGEPRFPFRLIRGGAEGSPAEEPPEAEEPDGWEAGDDDPDVLGVSVSRIGGQEVHVFVSVAEFIREEPLESELRQAVASALGNVRGVREVWEEDREVWGVRGNVNIETIGQAVSEALGALEDQLRAHIDEFG